MSHSTPNQEPNWQQISWQRILKDIAGQKENAPVPSIKPSQDMMIKAMHNYIDMINGKFQGNLFSDDYTLIDPVGTKLWELGNGFPDGFFGEEGVTFTPIKAELISPVSVSYSNKASMAFKLYMKVGEQLLSLDIIDVMTFNEDGKITSVEAFWGRANVVLVD